MRTYLAYCGDKPRGSYRSLSEALQALAGCKEAARIDRCETIVSLSPDEVAALTEPIGSAAVAPSVGAPSASKTQSTVRAGRAAVVFDQMFKRFAEILDRELKSQELVFHEIIGRGLEGPLQVSERVFQQPARDDYDVLKLLEELSRQHGKVIFFTGDRRLAAQARTLPGVHVVYLPPGEVAGKEMAIKLMKKEIQRLLKGERS